MKKIFFLIFVLLIGSIAYSQTGNFNQIAGKQQWLDSVKFNKPRNNPNNDSILALDYSTRKLIQVLKPGGGAANNCVSHKVIGDVIWDSLLVFHSTLYDYYIGCNHYTASPTTVTLAPAFVANPRTDIFIVDTFGVFSVLPGGISGLAAQPDPASQLQVAQATVLAGDTVPTGIFNTSIYKENVEWVGATNIPGGLFNYTQNPYAGLVSTYIPSFTNLQYITYQDMALDNSHDITEVSFLKMYIRLNAPMTSGNLNFTFFNNLTAITTAVTLVNGQYGFNNNLTDQYQLIAIPIGAFSPTGNGFLFNTLQIITTGAGDAFQLDNIILQSGGSGTGSAGVTSFTGAGIGALPRFNNVIQERLDDIWSYRSSLFNRDTTFQYHLNSYDQIVDSSWVPQNPLFPAAPITIIDTPTVRFGNGVRGYIIGINGSPVFGSTQWSVLDSLSTPAVLPRNGSIYLVGTSPTGQFSGHANQIATYDSLADTYSFQSAIVGDLLYNVKNGEVSQLTTTAWVWVGRRVIHQFGEDASYGDVLVGSMANFNLGFKTNDIQRAYIDKTTGNLVEATGLWADAGGIKIYNNGGDRLIDAANNLNIILDNNYNKSIQMNGSDIKLEHTGDILISPDGSGTHGSVQFPFTFQNSNDTSIFVMGDAATGNVARFAKIRGKNINDGFGNAMNLMLYGGTETSTGNKGSVILAHNGTAPSGNVNIGTITTVPTALLNVPSTTKGVLFAPMNTTQMNAISSPANGLMIYNTDSACYCSYNGASWVSMCGGSGGGGTGSGLANFYLKDSSFSSDRIADLDGHNLQFKNTGGAEFSIGGNIANISTASGKQIEIDEGDDIVRIQYDPSNRIQLTNTGTAITGNLTLNTVPNGLSTDSVLTRDASTGVVNMRDAGSFGSTLQQAFDKAPSAPQIDVGGNDLIFTNAASFENVTTADPTGQGDFGFGYNYSFLSNTQDTTRVGFTNLLTDNSPTNDTRLNLYTSKTTGGTVTSGYALTITTEYLKVSGGSTDGKKTKVIIESPDTLLTTPTYIWAASGDTLKKFAYSAGGGGTVTSVARTNGLGITASVANPTTTPNITIAVDTSSASILSRQRAAATYQAAGNFFTRTGDSASYINLPNETTLTPIPTSGVTIFDSSGRWSYRTSLGKTVSFSTSSITTNSSVIDSLPNKSGTFAFLSDSTTFDTKFRSDTGRTNIYTAIAGKGSGTVTSVARTNGLGISASVANSTTTPNITIAVDTSDASILSRQRAVATYAPISGGAYVSSTGTTGDINSYSATNTPSRIAAVASGQLFASAGTGTLPVWTNILATPVTTGTGSTAGLQVTANSLTTGNGIDVSTSSLTTGNLMKLASTSTVGNGFSLLNLNSSGANGTASKTVTGQTISVTNTGTTNTNVGLNVTASGASTNYAALFSGGNVGIGTIVPYVTLHVKGGGNMFSLEGTGNADMEIARLGSGNNSTLQFKTGGLPGATRNYYLLNGSDGLFRVTDESSGNAIVINSSGRVGIGTTSITSRFQLPAGTATAGTAPYKETAGVLLSAIEALTHESNASGGYRSTVALNRYAEGGVIADFVADVNNSGTSETDLLTYTTKASTLAATGEKLVFNATGTFNDLTATSQLQFYFGGTNIGNSGALTVSATGGWTATITVIRTGSTTARSTVNLSTPGASTAVYTTETDITGLTFTNTNIIKVTGTAAGATGGSSDITAKMGFIMWWGAANN